MSRLQILQAFQTQLATITQANGYLTNIGQNIVYWLTYEQDYNGAFTLTFKDVEAQYEKVNNYYKELLTVEVQAIGYVQENTKLTDSCNILADLKQALIYTDWRIDNNNVIAIRPKLDRKRLETKGKQAYLVGFTVEIEYREEI